jgi:nitrate reductase assembly molybdenum cofactor insertion protein NarJ
VTTDPAALRLLAGLLAYPGPDLPAVAARCAAAIARTDPGAAARLARFGASAAGASPAALEEAYVSAFEVAPVASPYVGDQLFGASAERAYLLSGLAELRREAGLAPTRELADHVAEVLRLAAAPIPEDVRDDLVRDGLAPTLGKMRAALEAAQNPWADVVAAAADVLSASVAQGSLEVSP